MTALRTQCDQCSKERSEFDSDTAFELHMIHHDLEELGNILRRKPN
jgi:hypothetical protein